MISRRRGNLYGLIGMPTMGCVLGVVLLSFTCPTLAAAKNQVRIEYGEASTQELLKVKQFLAKERLLEILAEVIGDGQVPLTSPLYIVYLSVRRNDFHLYP